ncbi:MAG TPA: outer membrane protein assembly factor BamE [Alphaproteobacteria bacterium]|nr:outer membrane protein assembly factor BamE [Alphaproteobacteria bacterium]
MKTNALPFFLALCALAALAGCEPTIANRGDIIDPDKLALVKVGVSTREDVNNDLGTPTEVATFDNNVWYYVGRQTKQYSFLDPTVVKQKGIEIKFDDKGVVTAITPLNPKLAEDITPAPGQTPSYGSKPGVLRQLLGDLSHPTVPMQDTPNGNTQ